MRWGALPCPRALLPCVALLAGLIASSPARADVFGSISLVSASPFEQVEDAHDPAISGDGRYVVFDGSIGGVTGVWRRENRPGGNLEQVAGGDAELPSISQNGQYISFTTNEGSKLPTITDGLPDANEAHEAPNVYVRDMSMRPEEAGAFTLASAVNGSSQGLTYEYPPGEAREYEEEHYGSLAAGRSALSADGRKVVFVTTAASNLAGEKTPPLQVAVRDLETKTTELVSVEYDPATGRPRLTEAGQPQPVALQADNGTYGAVYTKGGPLAFGPPVPYTITPELGASISADGSTVAWMGQDIGEQARTLPGESLVPLYSEPLWRRIADGEQAPTRRITGGSDPENPQCAADPEEVLPVPESLSDPCQGPFATPAGSEGIWTQSRGDDIPRLSADGYTVAFLATAPLLAGGFASAEDSDVYVADMHEGVSRTAALRPLTELASGAEARIATDAPITDLAISPDGSQVAFTTERTVFPLSSPTYVNAPAAVPGLSELYDVDLPQDTLTRVTHGYEGGASAQPVAEVVAGTEDLYAAAHGTADGALAPSFSESGDLLAFSSTASNLVYGDGNTPPLNPGVTITSDGGDAFVVNRIQFGSTPTPQYISNPPGLSITPVWDLGVTAQSLSDGNVLLYVNAPSAGTLSALVRSTVRTLAARSSRATRGARRRGARARAAVAVRTRTVASATGRAASGGGLTTLLLTLAPGYRALAEQQGELSATANLTFTAPGQPALRQSIAVSFLRAAPKRPTSRRLRTSAAGSRGRRDRRVR
jgi:Tol biopolymer transport system component